MKNISNLNHGREPKWLPGLPNSQSEARRKKKTYYASIGNRCACGCLFRWTENTLCMACHAQKGRVNYE